MCSMNANKKKWRPVLASIDSSFYSTQAATTMAKRPTSERDAPKTGHEAGPASLHTQNPREEIQANRDPSAPDVQESLLTRVVLTPLRCVSFLLSLLLVDTRNHERLRPGAAATGNRFGRLRGPWVRKEGEAWVWRARRRKIMRAEMGQAFEVRKWVMVGLVVAGVVIVAAGGLVVRWVGGKVGAWLSGWEMSRT